MRFRSYLSFILVLVCSFGIKAQSGELSYAIKLRQQAEEHFGQADYKSASEEFFTASELFNRISVWDKAIDCKVRYAESKMKLSDVDGVEGIITRGMKDAEKRFGKESAEMSKILTVYVDYLLRRGTDTEKALEYAQSAYAIRSKLPDYPTRTEELMRNLTQIASVYHDLSDYPKQLEFVSKALDLGQQLGDKNEFVADAYLVRGVYYIEKNDYELAKADYQKSLSTYETLFKGNHDKTADACDRMAGYYRAVKDPEQQLKYVVRAFQMRTALAGDRETPLVAESFYNIADLYLSKADYDNALSYYQKALIIFIKAYSDNNLDVATVLTKIARCYRGKNNPDSEFIPLNKALAIRTKLLPADHVDLADVYNSLAIYYGKQEDTTLQMEYAQKALKIYESKGKEREMSIVYGNIAAAYGLMWHQEKEELKYWEMARDLKLKRFDEFNPVMARNYFQLGNYYRKYDDFKTALSWYQKSIICLSDKFKDVDIYKNPSGVGRSDRLQLLESLQAKAKSMEEFYDKVSHNDKDLDFALSTYRMCLNVIDTMRTDIDTKTSKQDLINRSMSAFEQTISLAERLHKSTNQKAYLEEAFDAAERSKAFLLLLAFRESENQGYGILPDSVLQHERDYKRRIAQLEEDLAKVKKEEDQTKITKLEDELLKMNSKYIDFKKSLKSKYPRYYNLKYESTRVKISALQKRLLDSKSAFLEYFLGEESIYLFVITKTDIQLYRIEKKYERDEEIINIEEDIDALHKVLSNYNLIGQDAAKSYTDYTALAYPLYERLLGPALSNLPEIDHLQIVTDGALGFIPFEALLTEQAQPVGERVDFSQLPYLLRKYTVNYGYSGTLLMENVLRKRRIKNNRVLAFAPTYEDESAPDASGTRPVNMKDFESLKATNKPLPGTQEEVKAIARYFKGTPYFGQDASESVFRAEASKYNIIHLAMHGYVNNGKPDYSFLAFSEVDKDTTQDGQLHAYELLNMSLNADLVVLSACETGYGVAERGEGVKSLARAFMYAGSPSVVMTLWKVNDSATARLMANFYEALSKGVGKDEALRQAKLAYLDKATRLSSHPAYWAGFVSIGNPEPIVGGPGWWLWILVVGFGAFYGWLWWRFMR